MSDVFIIDNSIFEDALTETSRENFKQSSKDFINKLFEFKLKGYNVAYIPKEAYDKFVSFFEKLEKTDTIKLIENIIKVEELKKSSIRPLSVTEAMSDLAYKFTLIPHKVFLVTNNLKNYSTLMKGDRIFFIINSDEALKIINHPNFICKDINVPLQIPIAKNE